MSGLKGTAHPSSKLTEDQVREIRRLLKAGRGGHANCSLLCTVALPKASTRAI